MNVQLFKADNCFEIAVQFIWTQSDEPLANFGFEKWKKVFSMCDREKIRKVFLGEDELELMDFNKLTIYRGASRKYMRGLSWTSEIEKAKTWADNGSDLYDKKLYAVEVTPTDVLFFTNDRGEVEFVPDPNFMSAC